MHYEGNKEAKGYSKSISETEQLVRANLSKDGKTLDITAGYVKEYGAKDISKFDFLRDLTSLNMGTNLIGQGGAKFLAQSETLVNLTSLNLFYNQIGNDGVKYVAVSDNLLSLQNLNLTDNEITDEGAIFLAKFLPLFTNLTRLDIRYNKIKDEGKEALRNVKGKISLKHLLLDKVEGFQVNA
jgi:Ran GTPase-activating protein (RanGAP) involved in mRNA processing and transport